MSQYRSIFMIFLFLLFLLIESVLYFFISIDIGKNILLGNLQKGGVAFDTTVFIIFQLLLLILFILIVMDLNIYIKLFLLLTIISISFKGYLELRLLINELYKINELELINDIHLYRLVNKDYICTRFLANCLYYNLEVSEEVLRNEFLIKNNIYFNYNNNYRIQDFNNFMESYKVKYAKPIVVQQKSWYQFW